MKKMEDRISTLPDEILCHILSFLPTKKSVATSVLSKRWKPLWRSVTTLDFDELDYRGREEERHFRFVNSVYRVILTRDSHKPIQKFRVFFSSRTRQADSEDPSDFRAWVNAALQRGVEHLDVSLMLRIPPDFSSIFSCTTLVVLKLAWLHLKTVSSVVDLPFLKVLHLKLVVFSERGSLAKLLSGCPVLEEWKASGSYFENNDYETDVEFKTLPKLVRADISGFCRFFYLMKVVNNVHFLRMHELMQISTRLPLPRDGEGRDMFHNLIHIELVNNGLYESDWLEVLEFLKYCPKLQVLVIKQPRFYLPHLVDLNAREWQYPPSVPECILLHLKRCYLDYYRGTKGEFQFAKYIMQKGRFLKKMTICSSPAVKQGGKLKNLKKLSSCMRRSAACKLSFK